MTESRFHRVGPRLIGILLSVAVLLTGRMAVAADKSSQAAWRALTSGGHIAVMRHALAPRIGDPPGFRPDDCETQRRISAEGRGQARRLGETLREHRVVVDRVYSSQWCRCLETARLLEVGPVEALPALNSLFEQPGRRELQQRRCELSLSRQSRAARWCWSRTRSTSPR